MTIDQALCAVGVKDDGPTDSQSITEKLKASQRKTLERVAGQMGVSLWRLKYMPLDAVAKQIEATLGQPIKIEQLRSALAEL